MADVDRLKDIKYSEQIKLLLDHYDLCIVQGYKLFYKKVTMYMKPTTVFKGHELPAKRILTLHYYVEQANDEEKIYKY